MLSFLCPSWFDLCPFLPPTSFPHNSPYVLYAYMLKPLEFPAVPYPSVFAHALPSAWNILTSLYTFFKTQPENYSPWELLILTSQPSRPYIEWSWQTIAHGPIWPATCFCKQSFIIIKSHPFICTLSIVPFALEWQSSVVVKETVCPIKPKIITILPFQKMFAGPCQRQWEKSELPLLLIAKPSTSLYWLCNLRHKTTSLSFGFLICKIKITILSSQDEWVNAWMGGWMDELHACMHTYIEDLTLKLLRPVLHSYGVRLNRDMVTLEWVKRERCRENTPPHK